MKKFIFVIIAICFSIYMFGCGKKEPPIEESQEPMSMEQLSKLNTQVATSEVKAAAVPPEVKLEPLPPVTGPYKPKTQEIQTALQHAGFYAGTIDGKSGPQTKKAIEEFQKANGLNADGKVGPKTWALLSKHLEEAVAPASKKKSTLKTR